MARRRKIKKIHFEFEAHVPGQTYSMHTPRKKTKTILAENSMGSLKPITIQELKSIPRGNKFYKSLVEYLEKAIKNGKKVVGGETAKSAWELNELREKLNKATVLESKMKNNPSLENIKKYFSAEAELDKSRHKLIIRTVRESEKPVQARYGSLHSILTKELKESGINSSRKLMPQVFDLSLTVVRKLLMGKTPSNAEYKMAFITERF